MFHGSLGRISLTPGLHPGFTPVVRIAERFELFQGPFVVGEQAVETVDAPEARPDPALKPAG